MTGIYVKAINWNGKRQITLHKEPDSDLNNTKLEQLRKSFKISIKTLLKTA